MQHNRKIEILDCTLRDGGLGLEDASLNGLSNLSFSTEEIQKLLELFRLSKIDIIELGSIEISDSDKSKFSVYQNIESVSNIINIAQSKNQQFAALYRGPDTPITEIPDWNESLCKIVRVIIRYSELKQSLDFCASLSSKGYKVCIQPMVTTRYSNSEIQLLIDYANEMEAYALYIVDSYGYMEQEELSKIFDVFDKGLKNSIAIGFHGHNNMNLAFSNIIALLNFKTNRDLIIDTTLLGMGQGAGNVQTELFAFYMNSNYGKDYNFGVILNAIEIIEKFLKSNLWGYSVVNLLPSLYKTAYKYSISMRNRFKLSYSEINVILSTMPEEYRHRYTAENVEELLKLNNMLKDQG
jgi:4-hydroxy 2-oxovalerate aldolase